MSLSPTLKVKPATSFYTVKSTHKNSILKTFTHTSIPIHTGKLLIPPPPPPKKKRKKKKEEDKRHNQLTKHGASVFRSSTCPIWWWATARKLGRCCSGLFHVGGLLAKASPTPLTKTIWRRVQHILQHLSTTMPFVTVSTITYFWMASTAPQADSWWLGHVEPDDV